MMNPLLAASMTAGYTLSEVAIFVVIVAAFIALVAIALNQFKTPIPAWVWHVIGVVVVAVVVIIAIKFIAAM